MAALMEAGDKSKDATRTPRRNLLKSMFRESDNESSEGSSDDEDASPIAGESVSDDSMTYESLNKSFSIILRQERKKGIAHQLWPAAAFLSHYLEQHTSEFLPQGTSVLELGAGIGLCGLVCHKLHASHVVLTDLPVAIPLLDTNIGLNCTTENVQAAVLSWGNANELTQVMTQIPPSERLLCVAADCVYWENLFQPFFETVRALVVDHNVDVLLAHVKRWKRDERFFKLCRKHMRVDQLVEDISHDQDQRIIKRIYRITKKS
ncbi:hypothetical protein LEN26_010299 [Aphanomyces euteiches]|nr:hypothetical protein LEN26_010299 [Aphanomyces euteiches]